MSAAALVNKTADGVKAHFQKRGEAGIFISMADWPLVSPHIYTP
jgi:hypothetical protein